MSALLLSQSCISTHTHPKLPLITPCTHPIQNSSRYDVTDTDIMANIVLDCYLNSRPTITFTFFTWWCKILIQKSKCLLIKTLSWIFIYSRIHLNRYTFTMIVYIIVYQDMMVWSEQKSLYYVFLWVYVNLFTATLSSLYLFSYNEVIVQ